MDTTCYTTPLNQFQTRPQTGSLVQALSALADGFAPISLKQMEAVALFDRVDIKFVLSTGQLLDALAALRPYYRVLAIDGRRLNHYRSLYFDTPDFELYHAHVNERAERYKVRSREYTDTRLSFIEVKHRTRKDRTVKQRISTSRPLAQLTPEIRSWLGSVSPLDGSRLRPVLWNTFTRMTLVNMYDCERVTIDVDLAFSNDEQRAQLDGLVVAEAKMDAAATVSPFLAQVRAQKIHPQGFSKYAMGVSLLFDQVKKNALKPKLRRIEKLVKGSIYND